MSAVNLKSLVNDAVVGAEKFIESFYKLMDTKRSSIYLLYRPTSLASWNGNAFNGVDEIKDFLISLPSTQYTIKSSNAHPLPMSPLHTGYCCIQIAVYGTVKYGADIKSRPFSQFFILTPDVNKPGNFYVASDCFRLV